MRDLLGTPLTSEWNDDAEVAFLALRDHADGLDVWLHPRWATFLPPGDWRWFLFSVVAELGLLDEEAINA